MKIVVTSSSGSPDPEIRQEIEAVDQALRQNFSGFDPDVIAPEIDRSFEQLEVQPRAEDVLRYARAISERNDFELLID